MSILPGGAKSQAVTPLPRDVGNGVDTVAKISLGNCIAVGPLHGAAFRILICFELICSFCGTAFHDVELFCRSTRQPLGMASAMFFCSSVASCFALNPLGRPWPWVVPIFLRFPTRISLVSGRRHGEASETVLAVVGMWAEPSSCQAAT